MHTTPPIPEPDPTRDPKDDPLIPPGHRNNEPQHPDGPPDKDPVYARGSFRIKCFF